MRLNLLLALGLCMVNGVCFLTASTLPAYTIHTWGTDDGLPDNFVTSIVQTQDGYMWIGTPSGLARFDGNHFTVFNNNNTAGFPNSPVMSLFEGKQRNLWIGYNDGELTRYRNGHFKNVKVQPSWKDQLIWQIGNDRANNLWLINHEGLFFRLKDDLLLTPAAGKILGFHAFQRDVDGTMWIMRNGVLSVLKNNQLQTIPFDESNLTNAYVQAVCPGRDGGLWVASNGRLRKWSNHNWTDDLGVAPWRYGAVNQMIETRDGFLAVGTPEQGLYLICPHGETLSFNHTNGFHNDSITALDEDREGDLWVGTGGGGLVMLCPSTFTTLNPPDDWRGRRVMGVTAGQKSGLWADTDGAGVYNYNEGRWTNYLGDWGATPNFSTPYLYSIAQEVSGRVWIGSLGSGLFVQRGDHFEKAPGWENVHAGISINALLPEKTGGWWVGTSSGLARYNNDKITWLTTNADESLLDVQAIVEGNDGSIWFGMNGHGLGCLKNGLVRQFRKADGLASDSVRCLYLDENGVLWIGTSAGLNRFKEGRFVTINAKQGLPNEFISDIEDDDHGYFWISSQGGVIRVSKAELNLCADGGAKSPHFWCYDKNDGLPTKECSGGFQPAGCMDPNGCLYFPTSKGLVKVDPANLKINPLPPPVVIENFSVDNQQLPVLETATSPLKIKPGRHRFEFDYVGLSFVAPKKVHYKYRLNGLDTEWLNVGNRTSADYSFIPPGHYTFSVIACNNDGIWNEKGASLSFSVLPFYWQTIWFRAAAGMSLIMLAGGVTWLETQRRARLKFEQMQRQHAVESERVRIARDIHDDLGTHLTRITMLSESARNEPDDSEQSKTDLEQIYDTARELTRAMDEIVWVVNPKHDSLESLVNYLGKYAQDFLKIAGIRYRLDMPAQFQSWSLPAEVRHNLFLAFKESLNNIVRHAAASEVCVTLCLESTEFKWTVEDNGRGFVEGGVKLRNGPLHITSGNGLENMRGRLMEIGGRCEIWSLPGKGTKVSFIVPIKVHVI